MSQKSRTAEATLRFLPARGTKQSAEESEVSAISRITALMELAAARLVQQGLDGAHSSVGIAMNVTHAAPAIASGDFHGANVRAVASYRGVAGKLHYIVIDAFDESGLIASAEHTRAIVIGQRKQALARRRIGIRSTPLEV
jgi:fluoroacetyl-CoA thioesterase